MSPKPLSSGTGYTCQDGRMVSQSSCEPRKHHLKVNPDDTFPHNEDEF